MVISTRIPMTPEEAETFVSRRVSLRHLRVVLALSEGGSIGAAAELMHVTQPAISKALGELERGLGQTLFNRRGRGIRATVFGETVIELARKIESTLRRGGGEVASLVRGATGELQIGTTNAALTEILPRALAAMKGLHPTVALSVHTHSLTDLFNDLRQGRLDLVVARTEPARMPPDLQSLKLLQQTEVVTISYNHPLARTRRISWEALLPHAWVWPLPGTRSRALQDRFWQAKGLPLPSNVIHTGDLMLTLSMMKRLPLVAVLPLHVARTAAQTGIAKILPLEVSTGLSELHVWHLPEPQGELVERFKTLLSEAAQSLT
jgi:DNA-binding transcriptional LysR family regulator